MRVLVVGANGDVGSRTASALLEQGVEVRGSVREPTRADDLARRGVSLVTAALAEAEPAAPLEVGGPEVLSWRQVAEVYGELLGRRVRVVSTPAAVYAGLQQLMRVAGEVPSATMGLNRFLASTETVWEPGGGLLEPAELTTVRDYLAAKLALPPHLAAVP